MALPFRDRVVQWAIHLAINDTYEKSFITHSYACITDRGTHKAIASIQRVLRHCNSYNLLEKIQKYKIRRYKMFTFRNRETKEIVKQVDITTEELENDYENKLVNIFAEYDVYKHTANYDSPEQI